MVHFVDKEWFLHERKNVNLILSTRVSNIYVSEWAKKAKTKILLTIRQDRRTCLERGCSTDDVWFLVLKMMNELRCINSIRDEIKKDFGLDLDIDGLLDFIKMGFAKEYDLYLRRIYLLGFWRELSACIAARKGESPDEQFGYFLSSYNNDCFAMGVNVDDFEFVVRKKGDME